MRLVSLQYHDPRRPERSFVIETGGGSVRARLPEPCVGMVGPLLWTLLHPRDADIELLLVLTDCEVEARWRAELRIGPHAVRVERGVEASSVALLRADGEKWTRVFQGAAAVQERLHSALVLPPAPLQARLQFALPPQVHEADTGDDAAGEGDSPEAFLMRNASRTQAPQDAAGQADLVRLWREAVRVDLLERYHERVRQQLDDAIEACGRVLDTSGELQELSRRLARVRDLRPLSVAEEMLLKDGPGRLELAEQRLSQLQGELERETGVAPSTPVFRDPLVMATAAIVVGVTVASFVVARGVALFNLFAVPALAVALLRWIKGEEDLITRDAAASARRRRLEQLREEVERLRVGLRELTGALGVERWEDWKRGLEERNGLEARVREIEQAAEEAKSSEEYRILERKRDRLTERERMVRERLAQAPPQLGVSLWELEDQVRAIGRVPAWTAVGSAFCATSALDEIRQQLEDAQTGALGLWLPLFMRLAGRLGVPGADETALQDGVLTVGGWRSDVGGAPALEAQIAEAIRLAICAAQVGGGAGEGWGVVVAAARGRMVPPEAAASLEQTWGALAERMQIVRIEVDA